MADTKISAAADPVTLVANDKMPLARAASTTTYAATLAEVATYTNSTLPYSVTTPNMDGAGLPGGALTVSRGDHSHPTDTSRYAASNPSGYQTAADITTALTPYAPLASPPLTGTPTAPTVTPASDSTTKLATTAFVHNVVSGLPPGGVTTIVAGGVLSGGTITSTGTVGLAVGSGISAAGGTIANSGVLSVDTATGAVLIGTGLQRASQTISVAPATTAALGGVIAGTGITINAGGTISAAAGGGGGTVTSVAQTFTGGIVSVAGSPVTTNGTLALTVAGTDGGVPVFNSASTWVSSPALAFRRIVLGGGGSGTGPFTSTSINTDGVAAIMVGNLGSIDGSLSLNTANAGIVTIKSTSPNIYNFNLPTTAGTAGQVLTSQAGGTAAMTWSNAGAGTVTSVVAGTGLGGGTITATGTLTNTGVLSVDTATGAVLIGTGLQRSSQTISVAPATTAALGGIIVGSGLSVNTGTLTATGTVVATQTITVGLANSLTDTIPTGTYDLGPILQGGTVQNSYAHVGSTGTLTYTGAIGSPGTYTTITGMSSLTASSATVDTVGTATAANVVAAGKHLYCIIGGTAPAGAVVFFAVKVP